MNMEEINAKNTMKMVLGKFADLVEINVFQ
jgi:hypothetical protein